MATLPRLIASFKVEGDGVQAPGSIVLRELDNSITPYATHFYNEQDRGYHHGHYFSTLKRATADFDERKARRS